MVQSQRLAYRQQSGHRLQAVHLHGFAGLVYPVPVQPGDVVVLRIGVVVAALRVAEFVARQHHRCAQRQHQRAEHVHGGLLAFADDRRVVGRPLDTEVRGVVHVRSVDIVLAVGLVVLDRVSGQVGERESVVARDVVDRGHASAPGLRGEQVGRTAQSRGHLLHADTAGRPRLGVGDPESAHRVAEPVVPLAERHAESAGPPSLWPQVPRLHDEFQVAEQQVGTQRIQERVMLGEVPVQPRQRHAEIESEPVDADALGPIPQRVHGERHHVRVGEVEGVAAAGGVLKPPDIALLTPVIRERVQTAPACRRPFHAAFAGVVVHHVHDDLEPGLMQRAHHADDLVADRPGPLALGFGSGVRRLGGEVAEWRVPPVVVPPALLQEQLVLLGLDGQQFDGGDAQGLQVRERGRVGETRVRAAQFLGQPGCVRGESLDVQLVQHGLAPRHVRVRGIGVVLGLVPVVDGHRHGHVAQCVDGAHRPERGAAHLAVLADVALV